MRRLPIFLVLDVSESMAGKAIDDVQSGIKMLTDALMSDPFAMETVYISVIAFAGKAKTITPLTYVMDFIPPKLPIGSGTNLSDALKVLMHEIDTNVKKNTPETKGDWKPLIFILTDGTPNDNYKATAARWKMNYGKYSTIAVLMGENSDATALKSITDNVLVFKETTKESYQAFFKWVSSSIQTSSKEIGENGKEVNASNIEKIRKNMEADLLADNLPTENNVDFLVLSGRCQKTRKPFILRYVNNNQSDMYIADGVYPVEEDYFELSSDEAACKNINSWQLSGIFPSCPHCHNPIYGHCSCEKWICLDPEHMKNVTCPSCGIIDDWGNYGSFDLNGGQG